MLHHSSQNSPRALLYQRDLPALEARMLLEHVTGWTRIELITRDQDPLPEAILKEWETVKQRRLHGEPMAYILGHRDFWSFRLKVTPAVLIPRPDTEILVEWALSKLPEKTPCRAIDLGTGSGAIALALAVERKNVEIWATDLSPTALAVAQDNAKTILGSSGQTVHFAQGSWWNAIEGHLNTPEAFDLIVSNPPYLEMDDIHLKQGDLRFEPQNALTDFADGLNHYREILAGLNRQNKPCWLKKGGWLGFEHGFEQAPAIQALMQKAGFSSVETVNDLAGLARVTVGCFL